MYYWDGMVNRKLAASAPINVHTISDGDISAITMDELGKWPSFEAQSWACKVVHAVLRTIYRVNPFSKMSVDEGPWKAEKSADDRVYLESASSKMDVLLRIDAPNSVEERLSYAEGIADQLNGKLDNATEAFLRELSGYAPEAGKIVAPTALMGIGIKARLLLGRLKKVA
ncbi:hypothetical protein D3C86_1355650 [compost metagenome]